MPVGKGSTPAKSVQNAVNTAWGANKGTTSVADALRNAPNKTTIPVPGNKSGK
jgi:hypothetical protein